MPGQARVEPDSLTGGSTGGTISFNGIVNNPVDSLVAVFTEDATAACGRLHHLAYRLDNREDVLRAADLYTEHGIPIENGPGKHAIGQTFFVYVYEPGGNRVELCAGGYHIVAPDWQPVRWTEAERARGQAWGASTVASFHTHGTPVLDERPSEQEGRRSMYPNALHD